MTEPTIEEQIELAECMAASDDENRAMFSAITDSLRELAAIRSHPVPVEPECVTKMRRLAKGPFSEVEWACLDYIDALTAQLAEANQENGLLKITLDAKKGLLASAEQALAERDAQLAEALQDAEIGRKWRENSSLEEWFPFTAQELAEARRDAERGKLLMNGSWLRYDDCAYLAVRLPANTDLSCKAMREDAIDAAIQESKK